MTFETLDEACAELMPLMGTFPAHWCVAGGWAIDLFLDRVTRSHADVELAIFRQDQVELHTHFADWRFQQIADGDRRDWNAGEFLELPVHEIHGRRAHGATAALEYLLNERDRDDWVYRRNVAIRLPIEKAIIRVRGGLSVLAPEIVMLFKSKSPREKDFLDFENTFPQLAIEQRGWLKASLATIDPDHAWLKVL